MIPKHTWYPPTPPKLQDVPPQHWFPPLPPSNKAQDVPVPATPVSDNPVTIFGRSLMRDHHHHEHDSDSDSDTEEDQAQPKKKPCPHHMPPDNMFAGAIGFGAEGDLCMYQNLDALSPPCQQAVADLYQLREQFWLEDQVAQGPPPPPHHHPFLLLLPVLLLGGALLFKRRRQLAKAKQINSFLSSLHGGDASLKAAVEQQAKMSIPSPIPIPPCSAGNFCCRLGKMLALLVFVLFSSLFIAVSSLEITSALIGQLEAENNEPVSTPIALVILISICTIQLAIFFLIVKLGKKLYVKYFGSAAAPSAPLEDDEDHHQGGGGNKFLLVRRKIQELKNFAFNSFRTTCTPSSQYYTPLLAQEEATVTEMTSVNSPTVVR